APQGAARENAEPDLHLVEPRRVAGRVDEADAVRGVLEELLAARHTLKNTCLAFDAEVRVDTATRGHEPYERLGLVRVELVEHEDPRRSRIRVDGVADMHGKILLGACGSDGR